jgi:hypothetical protein
MAAKEKLLRMESLKPFAGRPMWTRRHIPVAGREAIEEIIMAIRIRCRDKGAA